MEILLIGVAITALLLFRCVDAALVNYRRQNWRHVEGRVLATRYVACGENVYPTALVSYLLAGGDSIEKLVQLAGVDLGGIEAGSSLRLLLHPRDPERCLVGPLTVGWPGGT